MIWGFIGPEGGGKSTAMTYYSLLHYKKGGAIRSFPGYDVYNGGIRDDKGNRLKLSTAIDVREMVTMSAELRNTVICIDEIQNFMDSSRHNTIINQMMGYVGMQRRKLNMGIFYTTQNWMWLYNRYRWLTHLLTYCFDLHWSPWGKQQRIKKGELIRLTTYDCKGFLTGKPWTPLRPKLLRSKKLHDCFESYAVIDIYEGMKKLVVKKPEEIIDLRPPSEVLKDMPDEPEFDKATELQNNENLINDLAKQGVDIKTLSRVTKRLNNDGS